MITGVFAGLIGLLFLVLSARVITYRRQEGISLGDGEDKTMRRRVRAQANCAEYAPIALIMMLVVELQNGSAVLLVLLGAAFLIGRVLHGIAFSGTGQWILGRVVGMVLTLASLGCLSLLALYVSIF